jgi:hypothetical protein
MFIDISRTKLGQRAAGKSPFTKKGVLIMNGKLQGKKIAIVATDDLQAFNERLIREFSHEKASKEKQPARAAS